MKLSSTILSLSCILPSAFAQPCKTSESYCGGTLRYRLGKSDPFTSPNKSSSHTSIIREDRKNKPTGKSEYPHNRLPRSPNGIRRAKEHGLTVGGQGRENTELGKRHL
ncbi:uncharacterized protein BDV14DRAFT_129103 [Aspergillus stella-maris]|uniref:uncharacterized protein n=1 Tax=Aspergillus stella-maris TaxID=1810926 RepID=UPI003CCCF31F